MAKIPRIKPDILSAIEASAQSNPDWAAEYTAKLKHDNPVITAFLMESTARFGLGAGGVGLMIYKIIESQMEADELEELFKDD